MSNARIIDGKEISARVRNSLIPRIEYLAKKGIVPGLAVVLIGDDSASKVYVNMKSKAFGSMRLISETIKLPADISQESVLSLINDLNINEKFHGILLQLPIPKHLDSMEILQAVDPDKDADGLHPTNMGRMLLGIDCPLPCTPHGIIMLLKYSKINTCGQHVVVLGRSNIVGKPIANLLMQKREMGNATVTLCHTKTRNLKEITNQADILIVALGQPEFVDRSFVKPGVVVIDVGVNRVNDSMSKKGYRLVGDVKFNEVKEIADAITPVPGGVGPMTISMLIANTVYLAEKHAMRNKRKG
ncbi:MAG: bifunctional 5,10-methylene-tetrahydrofolate dehydrogenase/5,10-methylene-tetrahydrofolate cyclohydrolase [Candidatus Neomarinimicrobiota bacterium]|nr:MAG: bifunctional 5,10-methylene-tetrahydrofolate dehydrogenase/5,10-methylene-tetrahydrofolate cyclohydrolase [Candidatus Neomarinimicrobiota bacterium]